MQMSGLLCSRMLRLLDLLLSALMLSDQQSFVLGRLQQCVSAAAAADVNNEALQFGHHRQSTASA